MIRKKRKGEGGEYSVVLEGMFACIRKRKYRLTYFYYEKEMHIREEGDRRANGFEFSKKKVVAAGDWGVPSGGHGKGKGCAPSFCIFAFGPGKKRGRLAWDQAQHFFADMICGGKREIIQRLNLLKKRKKRRQKQSCRRIFSYPVHVKEKGEGRKISTGKKKGRIALAVMFFLWGRRRLER